MSKSDRYHPCSGCGERRSLVHGPCEIDTTDSMGETRTLTLQVYQNALVCSCNVVRYDEALD